MTLDDLSKIPEGQEEAVAKKWFRELRSAVFNALPGECFLKSWNRLNTSMLFTLDKKDIDRGVVRRKDICSLCSEEQCPYYKIRFKNLRIIKLNTIRGLRRWFAA